MRWTQAALLTRAFCTRTAKSCGPDASTPASSLVDATPQDDGDKKARSPGRARNKPLKPLRAGMPGVSGCTRGHDPCAFYLLHTGLRAQLTPGIPHALFLLGAKYMHNPGASRRGIAHPS